MCMKVKKLMSGNCVTCETEDSLALAVRKMWENDCGMIPVVSDEKVVGVVTDRDVAVAVSSSGRPASEIRTSEIINGDVTTCKEKESVSRVLKKMAKKKLRRLPVVDRKGRLTGIFSIADAVNASASSKKLRKPVLKAIQGISKPHPIMLFEGE